MHAFIFQLLVLEFDNHVMINIKRLFDTIKFFAFNTKLSDMLYTANARILQQQKIQWFPLVGLDLKITGSGV